MRLLKDEKVVKYFNGLESNGNFHRLLGIYNAALLLQGQGADTETIDKFLRKKVSAAVKFGDCSHCALKELFEYCKGSLLLFDLELPNYLVLQTFGKTSRPFKIETALTDAALKARKNKFVFGMLELIKENEPGDSKERFDKLMEQIKKNKQESKSEF